MKVELPKQNNFEIAYNRAAEMLRRADLRKTSTRCGIQYAEGYLSVLYFNSEYRIHLPDVSFQPEILSMMERILVLHYLTEKADHPAKGEYVAFKNLPGASFYSTPYRKRSLQQIIRVFGETPDDLLTVSRILGATPAEFGDISVRLQVFPKIETIVVLYRGDEEFPPEAEILYRDDVINYLSLEDITVLSGIIASRLSKGL
jgi:hypothetical protein